jgi:hypothetical protein
MQAINAEGTGCSQISNCCCSSKDNKVDPGKDGAICTLGGCSGGQWRGVAGCGKNQVVWPGGAGKDNLQTAIKHKHGTKLVYICQDIKPGFTIRPNNTCGIENI